MICSRERRVLFIHVQKTGGMSLRKVLLQRVPGAVELRGTRSERRHTTLASALELYPHLKDYWTFGFVRNPWARMYSWHSMVIRRGESVAAGKQKVVRRLDNNVFWQGVLERYPTFEQFVLEGPDEFERLRRSQGDYLRAPGKRADFIGRTESLDEDLAQVLEILGLPAPEVVPHNNAAAPSSGSYRDHYTPAMRDRVAELFASDIEEFGYDF